MAAQKFIFFKKQISYPGTKPSINVDSGVQLALSVTCSIQFKRFSIRSQKTGTRPKASPCQAKKKKKIKQLLNRFLCSFLSLV